MSSMSQQKASSSQAASRIQSSPTPALDNFVFLDEVDIGEQVKIHTRISRSLESSYEAELKEAIRRSLLSCPEDQSSQTDRVAGNSSNTGATEPPSAGAVDTDTDTAMSQASRQPSMNSGDDDSRIQRPRPGRAALEMDSDAHFNGLPDIATIDLNDADNEGDGDDRDVPRSRKSRFRQQQRQSERRPSLDRMNGEMSERRPSLDRRNDSSERRPSQDRMNRSDRERRSSLEMRDSYRLERRPSLKQLESYGRSERRPSIEQLNNVCSERRPSLDRMERRASLEMIERSENQDRMERRASLEMIERSVSPDRMERRASLEMIERSESLDRRERRPSLEMIERRQKEDRRERRPSLEMIERRQKEDRERRPSLERVDQRERRSSLDRMQSAEECLQTISGMDSTSGPAQGINTLRPWPLNNMGIPSNWDPTRLPGDGDGLYQLVELSPVDREYSAVTVDFEEAGLKVVSVERLQNTMLLERFNHEKEHLLKTRPPDFELNEKYLYHGTQANKHCLCEEGLDHRLSFQGCFGRGIYFSDNPRKCMQYATSSYNSRHNINVHPMILVCRVLLGESKVYQQGIKDSSLKREPEKPKAKGGWRYYDSVQGIPVDYPEFVVYDNRRSMIEYIVTFEEVAYRSPPAASNFYTSQVPQLYKVEPITLPIPEDELDRLYMLCPDTDSDGSCDEHTREVERLRDNVKRAKAKRLGIPYRPPTKEEKRYERLHWKRVCYYSCPPGSPLFEMMIIKKKQEKAERMKRKAEAKAKKAAKEGKVETPGGGEERLGAVGSGSGTTSTSGGSVRASRTTHASNVETEDYEVENDSVAEVLSTLIADFLHVTSTDDVAKARCYILDNSMDLDKALCQFFRDLE